jgi:hypothetical protein
VLPELIAAEENLPLQLQSGGRKETQSSWRWVKSGIRNGMLEFVGEQFRRKKLPAARFSAVAHRR